MPDREITHPVSHDVRHLSLVHVADVALGRHQLALYVIASNCFQTIDVSLEPG